ncbi:hypothetical protein P20480_3020 [Pseudoalteromonas sp. BSi20480]|nr:hypothetical protein P20480_3020 [Pseudoalteromonas sp. BSi20480]
MPKGAMSERTIQDIEAIGNVITKLKENYLSHLKMQQWRCQGKRLLQK